MNCIDKLLSGVTKKVCPQGILRGFTGNIVLRDWRGWNQDNPKQEYKTEVKLECNKYLMKPMSDTFLREDNISLFDHSLTANLENISNDALQVLTGIQQIPVIVLVELTDLSYIELFPRNGGKLSFKNDFASQSKDKCQLTIKPFWKDQHEDYPPFNYVTELSVISMSPIDNSIDVAISTAFSLEFNTSIKSSEIAHTIILREAFSKMVIENFIVSPTSDDITIEGSVVTFHPTSNLSEGVEYEIIVPQGTFENIFGQQSRYIGSGEWNFTTAEAFVPYLTVVQDLTNIDASGGQVTFTILSNTSWSIVEDESWVTLNQTSGTGDGVVTATIVENTGSARQSDITFSASGITPIVKYIDQAVGDLRTWQALPFNISSYSTTQWNSSEAAGVYTFTPKTVSSPNMNPYLTTDVSEFTTQQTIKFKYRVSGGVFIENEIWPRLSKAGVGRSQSAQIYPQGQLVDQWIDVELSVTPTSEANQIWIQMIYGEPIELSHILEFKDFYILMP